MRGSDVAHVVQTTCSMVRSCSRSPPAGEPFGILATAACAGAAACVAPVAASVAAAAFVLAVGHPRVGRRFLASIAAFVFVVAAWRASAALTAHAVAREKALYASRW